MNNSHPSKYLQNDISDSNSNSEVVDLRQYWRTLLRYRYGILGLGGVFAVLAGLLMLRADDIYVSSATLLIESSQPQITSIQDMYGLETQTREYFSTQFELLKGRNLAERVVRDMELMARPEFALEEAGGWFGGDAPVDAEQQEQIRLSHALTQFDKRLNIVPVRNTDLVNIFFESTDPKLAAAVANRLANAYIESYLDQRLASTEQASEWMTERLSSLKQTLDASVGRLQDYMESEHLVDVEGVATLNIQELDELTTQNNEARRHRAEAETALRQTQMLEGASTSELMRLPAVLNHPVIARVSENIAALEQQTAELSKRYGRNHPRMVALASQRAEAERNLGLQLKQVLATIETDYQVALNNERVTLERLEAAKGDFQGVNRKRYELNELEREVETNRQLYDMFFTRIRETAQTDSFKATNAILVDPAAPALEPGKPNRSLVVLLALMAGLVLGTVLAFLREMLDNTVHTPADIEDKLGSTTLGIIPFVPGNKEAMKAGKAAYLGFMKDNHSSFSESFRTVRTGIVLSAIDQPYKVIAITSSVPNEGKTTISINLASVMGQMKRTLLIDADMRRPALGTSLGLPQGIPGLSDLIAGTAALKDCIYPMDQGGFSFMPGGHIVRNALELLSSVKFQQVLKSLGENFDQIIVDTPPTQAVSDALVIGSLVDAVVYVVKADATPLNAIRNGLARLNSSNSNVMGIILNQVDTEKQGSYYYGGYYDSYGYSQDSKDSTEAATA